MTKSSNPNRPYPGLHGVLEVGNTEKLSPSERKDLSGNISTISKKAKDPAAFFNDVLHHVHLLRNLQSLDRERIVKERLAEVDAAIDALARGASMRELSQIGRRDLEEVRRRLPNASPSELLVSLKVDLPKPRSGRAPDDALKLIARMLIDVFQAHLARSPSSATSGDFVALLAAISEAADGKPRKALHRVAEEALKMQIKSFSDGVTYFGRSDL